MSLCLSSYVSPSTQVSPCYSPPRPQVGVSGPLVPELGPSPSRPLLPWARLGACLRCLPQVNTKIRNPRATSLTSTLVPQPALDCAAPEPTGSAPKLEMCPDPPPSLPKPQPWSSPVCLSVSLAGCLLLSVCVPLRVSAGLAVFLSVPTSCHNFSVVLPFSRMTLVIILWLSLYL